MKGSTKEKSDILPVYWLCNLPIYLILLMSYRFSSLKGSVISYPYFIGLACAHAAYISWLLIIALPFFFAWLTRNKVSAVYIALILCVCSIYVLLIDRTVYAQIHTHLDWPLLQMIISPAATQIFNLNHWEYFFLITALMAVLIVEIYLWFLSGSLALSLKKNIFPVQLFLVLLGILTQAIYMWADACYHPRILTTTELFPWFHGATAKRFLIEHHLIEIEQKPSGIARANGGNVVYPLHPLKMQNDKEEGPNVLLIAIDSWRFDSLNTMVTPHIAHFTNIATNFRNHYSGGNSTRAGLFSLFYSVSPGLFEFFYRAGKGPVVFDLLKKRDYALAAYTSASALAPPFNRTIFLNIPNFKADIGCEDSVTCDQMVTKKTIQFITKQQKHQKRFFVFGFYDSAHAYNYPLSGDAPFQPTAKISRFRLHNKQQQNLLRNQYRNALYFIDAEIGKILSFLEQQDLLKNTLVIITADHGEEFDDNKLGLWGHNSNFTPAQTKVPLLVHWPNQRLGSSKYYVTSHYDIVPTLVQDVAFIDNPYGDYSLGRHLMDHSGRTVILIGSYNAMAIFSPPKKCLAVTNRLGYFQMQNMQGLWLDTRKVDSFLLNAGYQQMHHFSMASAQ